MKGIRIFDLLAVLFLTIACGIVESWLWGFSGLGRLIVLTITVWAFSLIVVLAARRVSPAVWMFVGVSILVVLSLPDITIGQIAARLPQPLEDPIAFVFLLALPMAIGVSALLLYSGLKLRLKPQEATLEDDSASQARRKHAARACLVILVLSALVLVKALFSFYHFMVWDTTGDSMDIVWLGLSILVSLFSSALLFSLLSGKARLAGLSYLFLIPLLIVLAARAHAVDFRQLTQAHAERARQAIEAYYARQGRYPQDIRDLTPWYALSLPGPVIIYGQRWCYEGGQDYYRLGYLDREHWSSPILFRRVYSATGHSPLRVDVCQAAIDTYRAQHPGWDGTLKIYGKPTPTPDIGE
jgi:hypothetical protein